MRFEDPDLEIAYLLGKEPETKTAADLADWLNLSPARIHALACEGVIPRKDGRFVLRDAVRAYVEHLRVGQKGRQSTDPDLNAEKLRLARANAEKIELANAKVRGTLVPVADVEATWAAVLRDVRAAMLAIPARVQQRLGHLTPHDVQSIDREVRDALEEASYDD